MPAGEGLLRAEALSISAGRRGGLCGATETGGERWILGGRQRHSTGVFFEWICSIVHKENGAYVYIYIYIYIYIPRYVHNKKSMYIDVWSNSNSPMLLCR